MEDWRWMTASALGKGIAEGKIDPVDLTETYLAAIDAHEHRDRIYTRVTADRARAEAEAARDRAKSGTRRSPLDGVPISWKDLLDSAGVATEAGSRLLTGRTPDRDALVLQNAAAAGLVCLGKTHMTELAFSGLGLNPKTASPPNVNDAKAVSGGSSSGAAASVAFGLAAAGIGSDTGGSVRTPSAWNDLTGLKTRHGRLSLQGVVPLCPSFDTVGPLCRSVADTAHLLAVMEAGKPATLEGVTLNGVRLAVLTTSAEENVEKKVQQGFDAALSRLQDAGATLERIAVPEVTEAMALAGKLFAPEAYATWAEVIEADPDAMYPPVRERFRSGREVSATDYIAAWQTLYRLREAYADAVAHFDAVCLPTVPILPPSIDEVETSAERFAERNLLALQNTRIGNLMGLAGVTLPTGTPSVGLLLQGPVEEKLLRLAAAAELALA